MAANPEASIHPLRDPFLNVFQGDVRNNIIAFSEQLWNSDSDVFLFMARKAACFFDCLRELGITDVRGQALSDRVLDMDLSFLKGKKVTLVDDCIFTGTTLYRAKNAVVKAGCSEFNTVTLAINKDTIRPALLPGGSEASELCLASPMFALSNSDCVRQNYDIVRAISIIPRPYDVDFPHSKTSKLSATAFDRLMCLPGWTAHDASSNFQLANSVRTFTFIPSSATHAKFCSIHGVTDAFVGNSKAYLPVAKIRLYARALSSSSWSLRLVPIIMFPPLKNKDVTQALINSSVVSDQFDFKHHMLTAQSRYRFLHFLLAHNLLEFFAVQANELARCKIKTDLRDDLIEMSFQTEVQKNYSESWAKRSDVKFPQPQPQEDTALQQLCTPLQTVNVKNPIQLVSEALTPFTMLYKERELSARKFVYDNGLAAAEEKGFVHTNRLIEGYVPERLLSRIHYDGIDTHNYLSVLLDRMIDLGIAVPTLTAHEDSCSRALRHGEDAIFGPAQERLLIEALKAYMSKREIEFIWGLELQKFIVLFVQIGIRNGLIERLNFVQTVDSSDRIISIKGHLHGPVPVLAKAADPSGSMGPPYIDGNETHPTWVVEHLIASQVLRQHKSDRGTQYTLNQIPEESIGTRKEVAARQLGRGLGAAVKNTSLNHDTDLVLLSTCTEPDQQLRALCGEIAIFRERWNYLSNSVRELIRKKEYFEARKVLRRNLNVFTAVNSGMMKYSWFINNKFPSLKEEIRIELVTKGFEDAADDWTVLWPDASPLGKSGGPYLWNCIKDAGRWLSSLNLAMCLISYWLVVKGKESKQFTDVDVDKEAAVARDKIAQARANYSDASPSHYFKFLNEITEQIDVHAPDDALHWCEESGKLLKKFVERPAGIILQNATLICNAYGTVDSIQRYPYAVYFDIPAGDERSSESLYDILRRTLSQINDVPKYVLPETLNPWKTGEWLVFAGNSSSEVAVRFASDVAKQLQEKSITFRAVVIGQLSKDEHIRRFSKSTCLAADFFPNRIVELRDYVLPEHHDCSISFANERPSRDDEVDKFCRISSWSRDIPKRMIQCGKGTSYEKTFCIAQVYLKNGRTQSVNIPQPVVSRLLLCTATNLEDDYLKLVTEKYGYTDEPERLKRGFYPKYTNTNTSSSTIFVARSSMGSGGSGGALATVIDAIDDIQPTYVLSCGLAFGRNPEDQELGDILVSESIREYEKERVGKHSIVPRGSRNESNPYLLQVARSVRRDFPLSAHFGVMLSGEKLVDDPDFKKRLWEIEPEAIGGEMEGAGVVAACLRNQIPWIIVKAICDWGENKGNEKQPQAAQNAFEFVFKMIASGGLDSPSENV